MATTATTDFTTVIRYTFVNAILNSLPDENRRRLAKYHANWDRHLITVRIMSEDAFQIFCSASIISSLANDVTGEKGLDVIRGRVTHALQGWRWSKSLGSCIELWVRELDSEELRDRTLSRSKRNKGRSIRQKIRDFIDDASKDAWRLSADVMYLLCVLVIIGILAAMVYWGAAYYVRSSATSSAKILR